MQVLKICLVAAAVCIAVGCQSLGGAGGSSIGRPGQVINAGPVTAYAADGVYERFRDQGFFVVRKGEQLYVLSSLCTHRKCKLDLERDRSFICPCHGSTFTAEGKVTEGPAKRDLPVLISTTNEIGQLLVTLPN